MPLTAANIIGWAMGITLMLLAFGIAVAALGRANSKKRLAYSRTTGMVAYKPGSPWKENVNVQSGRFLPPPESTDDTLRLKSRDDIEARNQAEDFLGIDKVCQPMSKDCCPYPYIMTPTKDQQMPIIFMNNNPKRRQPQAPSIPSYPGWIDYRCPEPLDSPDESSSSPSCYSHREGMRFYYDHNLDEVISVDRCDDFY